MVTKITVKKAQDCIKKEIEWCKSPEAQATDATDEFKTGFIAGLNQAILLLDTFRLFERVEDIADMAKKALRKERVKQVRAWEKRTGKSMLDTILNMPTSGAEDDEREYYGEADTSTTSEE